LVRQACNGGAAIYSGGGKTCFPAYPRVAMLSRGPARISRGAQVGGDEP
jgi:hypothetical protein